MTVYLVTTGEYDEFKAHSIWETRDLAEIACSNLDSNAYWADRTRIVPVEMNSEVPDLWATLVGDYYYKAST